MTEQQASSATIRFNAFAVKQVISNLTNSFTLRSVDNLDHERLQNEYYREDIPHSFRPISIFRWGRAHEIILLPGDFQRLPYSTDQLFQEN